VIFKLLILVIYYYLEGFMLNLFHLLIIDIKNIKFINLIN